MSEPPIQPSPLPPELANLMRDNEQVRRACADALKAAYQAGRDLGWTQGYTEGRAVTSALAHRSGCNLNHPAGEPCEVPSDVGLRPILRPADGTNGYRSTSGQIVTPHPSTGLMESIEQARHLLERPVGGDHAITRFPDGHTERTEL